MQIQMIIFDIDGVITDGKLTIDAKGNEYKSMDFRDIDAMFAFKRNGYRIAFVTGEDTEITKYFNRTFKPDYFYSGNKDKVNTVREISKLSGIHLEHICYIGDGKYDAPPMEIVGYSACPSNAIELVKNTAKVHLNSAGGNGCIHELMSLIFENASALKKECPDFHRAEDEEKNCEKPEKETKLPVLNANGFDVVCIDKIFKEHYGAVHTMMSSYEVKEKISIIVNKLFETIHRKSHIMIFGNGGGLMDSQHIAAKFVGRFLGERAVSCEALTANTSILAAIRNGYGVDKIFSRQIESKAKKDDILIGLIAGGDSASVINAFFEGKKHGTFNIAFIGKNSSVELEENCDLIVSVPSVDEFRVQELYMFIIYMILELLEHKFEKDGEI